MALPSPLDNAAWVRPVRQFTPRMVPQLWTAMLAATHADAAIQHFAIAIQEGEQRFFGAGDLGRSAQAVANWNRQVLQRSRLYHFSAELWAHALDCEADFPDWTPTEHDFPTRYGTVALERPIMVQGQPISMFTWGHGNDWPGQMRLFIPSDHNQLGRPIGIELDGKQKSMWLITAWTTALDHQRAAGMGPLVSENDFYMFTWQPGEADVPAIPHQATGGTAIVRALKIAFDLATQANIATEQHEPVPRPLQKRLRRNYPDMHVPDEVSVHNLRSRLVAALGARGEGPTPIERADSQYRVKCWPVRPVLDSDTGALIRRGYIAYRDPELLDEDTASPVKVWRGTAPNGPALQHGRAWSSQVNARALPGPSIERDYELAPASVAGDRGVLEHSCGAADSPGAFADGRSQVRRRGTAHPSGGKVGFAVAITARQFSLFSA